MKPVNFVTVKEFDPFMAAALNVRFVCFLVNLAKKTNFDVDDLIVISREILADADIPQSPIKEQ